MDAAKTAGIRGTSRASTTMVRQAQKPRGRTQRPTPRRMSYGGGGPASRLLAEGLHPPAARMGARGEALPANRFARRAALVRTAVACWATDHGEGANGDEADL